MLHNGRTTANHMILAVVLSHPSTLPIPFHRCYNLPNAFLFIRRLRCYQIVAFLRDISHLCIDAINFLKQLGERNLQCICNAFNNLYRCVPLASLDLAEVCCIAGCEFCQSFLAEIRLLTEFADALADAFCDCIHEIIYLS